MTGPASAFTWQRDIERRISQVGAAASIQHPTLVPIAAMTTVTSTSFVDTHATLLLNPAGAVGVRVWCRSGAVRCRLRYTTPTGEVRSGAEFETPTGDYDDLELDLAEEHEDVAHVVVTLQARVVSGSAVFAVVSTWA